MPLRLVIFGSGPAARSRFGAFQLCNGLRLGLGWTSLRDVIVIPGRPLTLHIRAAVQSVHVGILRQVLLLFLIDRD
jgi:hypothetical protein